MKYLIFVLAVLFLLFSCKDDQSEKKEKIEKKDTKLMDEESAKPLEDKTKLDSLVTDNGLKIHWLKKGSGDLLKTGDCVNIKYKVFLENGTLVEGNYKLNEPSVPFPVGFGMQTKGWDMALKQMKVGDEVEIYIPSKLARGEKGAPPVIPANANMIVYIDVLEMRKPTREIDGNKIYVFKENKKNKIKFNTENTIEFYTMTSSESSSNYYSSYRQNKPFTMKMKDAGTVPGLKKSLNNAKRADRMFVVVPPQEAYGSKGYLDLVGPNEHLLFNIFVSDVY